MKLLLSLAVTAWFPAVAAFAATPARSHNEVSLVSRQLRRGGGAAISTEAEGAQTMGRAVSHGGSIYMNTAIPGEIWSLKANTETNTWTWEHAGQVYPPDNPGAPMNPPQFPGPPMPAPAPAPVAAEAPEAAAAPAAAPPSCAGLVAAAEKGATTKGMFLGCKEFRYYGADSLMGKTAPYGCHCASWTVNCPFETCPIGTAFDSQCLAAPIKKMGFTALSKLSNFINPASVPKALRPFTVHPDYVSTCMYWLPKPANNGLAPVNNDKYASHLPDFGSFLFDYVGPDMCNYYGALGTTPSGGILGCAENVADEGKLEQTKAALLTALGQKDLSIISITCGKMNALITGPKPQLDAAAAIAKHPNFCWNGAVKQVCTQLPIALPPCSIQCPCAPPGAAPGPGPGPSPGPSPFLPVYGFPGAMAPSPMPFAFMPVFQVPMLAPAPAFGAFAPVLALAPAMAGAPGGPGAAGPAPVR